MNDGFPQGDIVPPGEPDAAPEKPAPIMHHLANVMAQSISDPYLLLAGLVAIGAFSAIVLKGDAENLVLLVISVLGFVLAAMFMHLRYSGTPAADTSVNRDIRQNMQEADRQDRRQRERRAA